MFYLKTYSAYEVLLFTKNPKKTRGDIHNKIYHDNEYPCSRSEKWKNDVVPDTHWVKSKVQKRNNRTDDDNNKLDKSLVRVFHIIKVYLDCLLKTIYLELRKVFHRIKKRTLFG